MPNLQELKLQAEIDKINAERQKIEAETSSLTRPLFRKPGAWLPILAGLATLGGSVAKCIDISRELRSVEETAREETSYCEGLSTRLALVEEEMGSRLEKGLAGIMDKSMQAYSTSDSGIQWNLGEDIEGAEQFGVQSIVEKVIGALKLPDRVVIHFRGSVDRQLIAELQTVFNSKGMPAPRPERIDGEYGNSVRFFHDSDLPLAEDVAQITRDFFATRECPVRIESKHISGYESSAKQGLIEIWLDCDCGEP